MQTEYLCDPIYMTNNDVEVISDKLTDNIYEHNRKCEEYNKLNKE